MELLQYKKEIEGKAKPFQKHGLNYKEKVIIKAQNLTKDRDEKRQRQEGRNWNVKRIQ